MREVEWGLQQWHLFSYHCFTEVQCGKLLRYDANSSCQPKDFIFIDVP
jgi:hypothetical protein